MPKTAQSDAQLAWRLNTIDRLDDRAIDQLKKYIDTIPSLDRPRSLSVKRKELKMATKAITQFMQTLDELLPMNIERVRELEKLLSPEEALEFALIKNCGDDIRDAIEEHGLLEEFFETGLQQEQPEDALDYAIENLPANIITILLKEHGYQPIPAAKQAKRDKALSH